MTIHQKVLSQRHGIAAYQTPGGSSYTYKMGDKLDRKRALYLARMDYMGEKRLANLKRVERNENEKLTYVQDEKTEMINTF